jgi:hypothetical protein
MSKEPERQGCAQLSEESVLAGVAELFSYDPERDDPRNAVARIYGAILASGCRGPDQKLGAAGPPPKFAGQL